MWCAEFLTRNFRNLSPGRIMWGPGLNLLTGKNGAGKTNCLEAIHLLVGWGPFGERKHLPAWQSEEKKFFVTGSFCGEENVFLAMSMGGGTVLKCDGRRISFPDIRSRIPSLAFLPRDMSLMDGSPSGRRSFLDRICALLFPSYARRLSDCRRGLRHRIILLRSGKNPLPAARALAPLVSWIWRSRSSAVSFLREGLARWEALLPGSLGLEHVRGGAGLTGDPEEDFWSSVTAQGNREKMCGIPLVGPHRDDLLILRGTREAAGSLSRGQKRRASVALMLAAGQAVEDRLKRKPLLLLDEVASELDEEGRSLVVESLQETGWQTFATAADQVVSAWPGKTWRVDTGEIFPLP